MSSNPNNAVGTNAAYGGRTSVNAFNDGLAAYSSGIMSGWDCVPNSGMTVSLGGDGNTRDVAVAEDNAGNKTTINNISGSPINVTLGAAPGSNSRIDVIVAYVDNPPTGSSSVADNPAACGIIAVQGTPANTPVVPNDGTIRTAITADGASGTTAYYVVLANINIASGTTDITSQNITAGANAAIGTEQINDGAVTSDKLNLPYSTSEQLTGERWIDGSPIYRKTINFGALPNAGDKSVAHGISGLNRVVLMTGYTCQPSSGRTRPLPPMTKSSNDLLDIYTEGANVTIRTNNDWSPYTETYINLYYTKSS